MNSVINGSEEMQFELQTSSISRFRSALARNCRAYHVIGSSEDFAEPLQINRRWFLPLTKEPNSFVLAFNHVERFVHSYSKNVYDRLCVDMTDGSCAEMWMTANGDVIVLVSGGSDWQILRLRQKEKIEVLSANGIYAC